MISKAQPEVAVVQSMTGYGRGELSTERYQFGIEIRSTNHRFLEIKLRFPRELMAHENEVRNYIRSRFSRGYLDVQGFLGRPSASFRRFNVDSELLTQVAAGLRDAGRELGISEEPNLSVLARFRELFTIEEEPDDPEELEKGLMSAVKDAVAGLEASRSREGEDIIRSLKSSMERFRSLLVDMEAQVPETNRRLAEGLAARIGELIDQPELSSERLHQETAFLTMKADVTEELERLKGHQGVFTETLATEGPRGRKMDFILQEMNRELNTTASKAGSIDLGHGAIEGKLELEKVREQVQNLE
jgi:uncharacterized protein (TIGR00255 family)